MLRLMAPKTVTRILFTATPFLLITATLLNRYSFLLNDTFDIAISRNAITAALPCITLGAIANIYQDFFSRISNIALIITALTLLAYIEYAVLHMLDLNGSGADFNALTFPLAFSIFIYCILKPQLSFSPIHLHARLIDIGRYSSGDIYLYHSLIWGIIGLLTIMSDDRITAILSNAEAVILIALALSFIKHKLKKQGWTLAKSK